MTKRSVWSVIVALILGISALFVSGCNGGNSSPITTSPIPGAPTIMFNDTTGEMIAPTGAQRSESMSILVFPWTEDPTSNARKRGGVGSEVLPTICSYDGVTNTWTVGGITEFKLMISEISSSRKRGGSDPGPMGEQDAEYAFRNAAGQIVRSALGSQHLIFIGQPGTYKGGAVFTVGVKKFYTTINIKVVSLEEWAQTPVLQMRVKQRVPGTSENGYRDIYTLINNRDTDGFLKIDANVAYKTAVETHSLIEPTNSTTRSEDYPAQVFTDFDTYGYDMNFERTAAFSEIGYDEWKFSQAGQYMILVDVYNGDKLVGIFAETVVVAAPPIEGVYRVGFKIRESGITVTGTQLVLGPGVEYTLFLESLSSSSARKRGGEPMDNPISIKWYRNNTEFTPSKGVAGYKFAEISPYDQYRVEAIVEVDGKKYKAVTPFIVSMGKGLVAK